VRGAFLTDYVVSEQGRAETVKGGSKKARVTGITGRIWGLETYCINDGHLKSLLGTAEGVSSILRASVTRYGGRVLISWKQGTKQGFNIMD